MEMVSNMGLGPHSLGTIRMINCIYTELNQKKPGSSKVALCKRAKDAMTAGDKF